MKTKKLMQMKEVCRVSTSSIRAIYWAYTLFFCNILNKKTNLSNLLPNKIWYYKHSENQMSAIKNEKSQGI